MSNTNLQATNQGPGQPPLDAPAVSNQQAALRKYWGQRLEGYAYATCLDYGPLASPGAANRVAPYGMAMGPAAYQALQQVAPTPQAKQVVLLSVLAVMLQKGSSVTDLLLYTPAYLHKQAPHTLVPVRFGAATDVPLTQYLGTMRDHMLRDMKAAALPLHNILGLPATELVQQYGIGLYLDGLQAWPKQTPIQFEMVWQFSDEGTEGLQLSIDYDTNKFDQAYVAQLAALYGYLLEDLLNRRTEPTGQVQLIPPQQTIQIIDNFNATAHAYPAHHTMVSLFMAQAAKTPHAVALEYEGQHMSYAALDAQSNQVAHWLQQQAPGTGQVIGLLMPRSFELMVALFGIVKAGHVYMPLSAQHPFERCRYALENAGAQVLIATPAHLPQYEGVIAAFDLSQAKGYPTTPINRAEPDGLAYIIYTSGSTGKPKGVQIKHQSLVNRLWWMQRAYPLTAADRIIQKTPVVFDVSVWELFWWSMCGARLVLAKPGAEKDPAQLLATFAGAGISICHFVPSMLNALLVYLNETGDFSALATLRHVFASGEALKVDDAQQLLQACPHLRLHNLYGPTEAAIDVSYHEVSTSAPYHRIPIGKPIDNTQLYIFNEWMQLQPVGVSGQLYIGGVNLSPGYINRPDLTEQRFVQSPLDFNQKLYKTGDLARWLPDGSIEFLGRLDNQVKIRGNRIELGEIEQAILAAGSVQNVVVLTRPSEGGTLQLVAYVQAKGQFDEAAVRTLIEASLPEYMMPNYFMVVPEIPVTVNGKANRARLLALELTSAKEYEAPTNALEAQLQPYWQQVLGKKQVGVTEPFFRSGGDSILAVRLIGALNHHLQLRLTMPDLYNHDSIRALATLIDTRQMPVDAEALAEVATYLQQFEQQYLSGRQLPQVAAVMPMSDVEQSISYISKTQPGEGLYLQQVMRPIYYAQLDVDLIQQALALLMQKHEVLRTGFDINHFAHIVYRAVQQPFAYHDLSRQPAASQQQTMQAHIEAGRKQHFDLDAAPLWRMALYKLAANHHELLFEYHHAILDGWSVATLITELNNTYGALLANPDYQLPVLQATYKNAITAELLAKKDQQAVTYWRNTLKGYQKLAVPSTARGGQHHAVRSTYDKSMAHRVRQAASQHNTTTKTVLFAAYLYALRTLSLSNDLLVGLVTFNRPLIPDGDQLLGCFLNTVPFRLQIPEGITWAELIKAVDAQLLAVKQHEHLSLFEIKQAAGIRATTGNPLFDTLFNLNNWHVQDQMRLQKLGTSNTARLDFNAYMRGDTLFDLNYEVTDEGVACLHEYASPFMTEGRYAQYEALFTSALQHIHEGAQQAIPTPAAFWQQQMAVGSKQLLTPEQHVAHAYPWLLAQWQQLYGNSGPLAQLAPGHYVQPQVQGHATYHFELPAAGAVATQAQAIGISPEAALLAAWQYVIAQTMAEPAFLMAAGASPVLVAANVVPQQPYAALATQVAEGLQQGRALGQFGTSVVLNALGIAEQPTVHFQYLEAGPAMAHQASLQIQQTNNQYEVTAFLFCY